MKYEVTNLIKLVKRHVYLYDICHDGYKNIGLKADTWESIAQEFGRDVSEVKLKWKTIKDGYLKYKKQKETETPDKPVCEYIWTEQLAFLDEYIVTRSQRQEARGKLPAKSPLPSRALTDGHRAKQQRTSLNDDSINKLISILGERQEYDDVDHLFKSYAKTFKKLSSQQQAHVKVEMAKLFADAELYLVYSQQPVQVVSSNQYIVKDVFDVSVKNEQ